MTDAAVVEAAARVISRLGPTEFTLADIAAEAGLAPATLIQRFGSKRGLLLELTRAAAGSVDGCFTMARAAHRSPLKALLASVLQMARMAETPQAMANTLAFLHLDLTDPEFRKSILAHSQATLAGYRALLDDAIQAGELRRCDTAALARVIGATTHGSLVSWAFFQKGRAADWLRQDLEVLLAPYRAAGPAKKRRKTRLARG
jgi:AcrR family transcriptional regulator